MQSVMDLLLTNLKKRVKLEDDFANDNADEFVVERISEKDPLAVATQTTAHADDESNGQKKC